MIKVRKNNRSENVLESKKIILELPNGDEYRITLEHGELIVNKCSENWASALNIRPLSGNEVKLS